MFLNREIIGEKYNEHAKYYSDLKDKRAGYATLVSNISGLQQRLKDLSEDIDASIKDIDHILNETYQEYSIKQNDEGSEISEYEFTALNEVKEVILTHLTFEIKYQIHITNQKQFIDHNYGQIEKFYEALGKNDQIEKTYKYLQSIVWFGENYKKAKYQLESLKLVTDRIIYEGYPSELPNFDSLDEHQMKNIDADSNADKLSVANEWLFEVIKDISLLDEPTNTKIFDIIRKEFPEFKQVPGELNLSFTKGQNNINKTNIDKALRFLFIQRHDQNIAEGTIKRKFDEYGMW